MKAVGYRQAGPLDRPDSLIDFETTQPRATGRDLLVRVDAVSVNPVDYKIRASRAPEGGTPAILGWDAAGEVVAIGDEVVNFSPGDRVWYAGSIDRPGSNSEFQLVDERITGRMPDSLSVAEAAALPLTSLTAFEMLFDRLRVNDPVPGAAPAVLVIGGAGGVGSITIQLLRALTDMTVIATASRPETSDWVKSLGAHHVIDHSRDLVSQVAELGLGEPGYVFSTTHTGSYLDQIAELIAPQGRFGLIDDPETLDVMRFKTKAVSTHWELMFTRPLFNTPDIGRQGDILNAVSKLVDEGKIRTTASDVLGVISAANIKTAHAILESGKAKGKLVLEGF